MIMVCFNNVLAIIFSVSLGGWGIFMKTDQICKMLKSLIPPICTHFHFSEKTFVWETVSVNKKNAYISEMVNMNIMSQNLLLITYQTMVTGFHLAL